MHRIFSNFAYILLLGMSEWNGIVNGQNPTIFDGVTALSPFKNGFWPVILLLFMFTLLLLPFPFVSYPPLIELKNVFTRSSFTMWNI